LIAVPCLPARFRATLSVELLRPVLLGVVRAGGCRRRYHPRLAGAVLPAAPGWSGPLCDAPGFAL